MVRRTIEVNDETSDAVLPAKLVAANLTGAKPTPQLDLCRRRSAP